MDRARDQYLPPFTGWPRKSPGTSSPQASETVCQWGQLYIENFRPERLQTCQVKQKLAFENSRSDLRCKISGSLQFSPDGFKPSFSTTMGSNLTTKTRGYLTYSTNWLANLYTNEGDLEWVLDQEESGMSTMIVREGERFRFSFSIQVGSLIYLSALRRWLIPITEHP